MLEVSLYKERYASDLDINEEFERNIRHQEDNLFNKLDELGTLKISRAIGTALNEYHGALKKYFLESIHLLNEGEHSLDYCLKRREISKEIEEKRSILDQKIQDYTVVRKPECPKLGKEANITVQHEQSSLNNTRNGELKHVSTMLAELDSVVATVQAGLFDGDENASFQEKKMRMPKDIDIFRDISTSHCVKVIDGVMVDFQTARAIVETFDNLKKEEHKKALLYLDIRSIARIAWKFVKAIRKNVQEVPAY